MPGRVDIAAIGDRRVASVTDEPSFRALVKAKARFVVPVAVGSLVVYLGLTRVAFVSAVAFATILAVVAALTLATSGAIAHDVYVNLVKRGEVAEHRQVAVARWSTVGVGAVAILVGLLAQGLNVAVLVILAIAIAASANFPIIVLSLFWRRFNTWGVIGGVGVGLASSVGLALLGPAVLTEDAVFPLVNPTLASMPLGFAGAIVGTLLGGRDGSDEAHFDKVFFRAQTGVGAQA